MSFLTATTGSISSSTRSANDTADLVPLNFSSLLVGRSEEIATLTRAHDRIRQPNAPSEILLIHGESGVGKSSLVKSVEKTVENEGGFFVSGKYEQNDNTSSMRRPYHAFVDAVTELCYLIQCSSKLTSIRKSIQDALSQEEVQLLANLMPSIQVVMVVPADNDSSSADTHKTPVINTENSFQVFKLLFRSFLAAICTHAPLVLFIDDLQWADEASRQLIVSIATDLRSKNLLLVGAYRDEDGYTIFDNNDDAPTSLNTSTLHVGPLKEEGVNEVVSQVTELRPELTQSLSTIVFNKTRGNPYFVVQYLELIHRQGLLSFSFASNKWEWDEEMVANNTNVSDTVVELLINKISSLSRDVQVVLMIAACLGFTFDGDILKKIMSSDRLLEALDMKNPAAPNHENGDEKNSSIDGVQDQIQKRFDRILKKAVQSGLIETSASGKYKFSHDRVQQSARAMFPKGRTGDLVNARLGEIILEMSRADGSQEWMLFSAMDLLTQDSAQSVLEPKQLSSLCLKAARRASAKSAFISAAGYADNGLACLAPDSKWGDNNYDLTLSLTKLSAEMHYSYGNFEKSEERILQVLRNGRTLNDKLRAYSVRVAILGARQELAAAIKEGEIVLKKMGVKLPPKVNQRQVDLAVAKTKKMLQGKTNEDLKQLPPLKEPAIIEAMRLLASMTIYDWRGGEPLRLVIHSVTMVQLTLQFGIGSFGPYGLSLYGVILAHLLEFENAFEYGALVLDLVKKPDYQEGYAHAVKVVHLFLHHLKRPVHESIDPFLKAYQMGKHVGNVELAAYCLQGHGMLSVVVGMPLESLEQQMRGYCDFCREFRMEAVLYELLPFFQLAQNLMGRSRDVLVLSGDGMVERDFIEHLRASNEGSSSLLLLGYARLLLLYLMDELELADMERKKVNPHLDFLSAYFMKYLNYFFCAMTCLGMAKKNKAFKFWYKRRARWYKAQMKMIAKVGSPNFVPMLKLMEAEERALGDRSGVVAGDFDSAISMSSRCGFHLIVAIACERAGVYMLACGDSKSAGQYLERAWSAFSDYGAVAKLNQMEKKYGSTVQFEKVSAIEHGRSLKSSRRLRPHVVENWKQEV